MSETVRKGAVAVSRRASRGRTPSGKPNPIDVHVGARVRLRRTLLGLSQERLGEILGVTFQQVQKYERGANRISASRLYDLSRVLDISIGYFYEDMNDETMASSPRHMVHAVEDPPDTQASLLAQRETLDLVRAYYRIRDSEVRRKVYDLAKALGPAEE